MSINNTQYGLGALYFNTDGSNNTAIGAFNSYSNLGGFQNTSVGSNAMFYNTTGSNNTSMGSGSLCNNTTGSLNTAIGSSALGKETIVGNYNVALGASALYNNSGNSNVAIGTNSLNQNINGSYNIALGISSGSKNIEYNYNTLIGGLSDTGDDSVKYSTALGYGAVADISNTIMMGGYSFDLGAYPTVIVPGNLQLTYLTSKSNDAVYQLGVDQYNNVIKFDASYNGGTTFQSITVSGKAAFGQTTIPISNNTIDVSGNIATTADSFFNGITVGLGGGNVSTNTVLGYDALIGNTNGGYNVAIGYNSGSNQTDYNYNTLVGANADILNNSIEYSTAIGYGAIAKDPNTIVLGGNLSGSYPTVQIPQLDSTNTFYDVSAAPIGVDGSGNLFKITSFLPLNIVTNNLTANGYTSLLNNVGVGKPASISSQNVMDVSGSVGVSGTFSSSQLSLTSDYRIKENVQNLMDFFVVDNLRPVTYINKITQQQDIGLIAHELQEIIPFLVTGQKDDTKMQTINYLGLIPILIKEIKDLKNKIKYLESKN